jgi:hypothetical protein
MSPLMYAGDMVHLIHVVPDVSMEAGSMPIWFGAYDAPFGPPVMLSHDAHAVRSFPLPFLPTSSHVVRPLPHPVYS